MSMNEGQFSSDAVLQHLQRCLSEEQILLDPYIDAYDDLTKFIDLLGTLFGFVNKDVREKLRILRQHRAGAAKDKYTSVQLMHEYEVSNKLTESQAELPNGSRTLLRLHRALLFIKGFLKILSEPDSSVKLTDSVHKCYKNSLAQYHGYLVQKGVGLALYTLPSKEHLLKMLSDGGSNDALSEKLKEMNVKLDIVYNSVQESYEQNNLLNLP